MVSLQSGQWNSVSSEVNSCSWCTGCCYLVAKWCQTCDPMQAPVSMRFPRWGFWSRLPFSSPGHLPFLGKTHVSCIGRQVLYCWAIWEVYTNSPPPSSNNLDRLLVLLNSSKVTSRDPGARSLQSDITPQLWPFPALHPRADSIQELGDIRSGKEKFRNAGKGNSSRGMH